MISLLIFAPLVAALATLFFRDPRAGRWLALVVSALAALLALGLWLGYDVAEGGFQYLEEVRWIPAFGIDYRVALDGLSLPFVFLTALLTATAVLAEWRREQNAFFALFLVLQGALTGVFAALDLVLFFVAFELAIIPMVFVIGLYGYAERRYAAVKFLLYSLFGSIFLFVGILATGALLSSFDYRVLLGVTAQLEPGLALALCLGFALAFLVKLPAVPLHTWLPHAHTEAPTAGSILLAGILLKMGGYGLIRFNLGLFPEAMVTLQPYLAALAVIGILYGGYVALGQSDLKRLVAYSSVNHMGFALLGIASLTALGVQGAVYQMLAHGVITGLMFMLVGMLSLRTHTRAIAAMRGVYAAMPVLGGLLWLALLGGAGVPGMAGFLGEVKSLMGAFQNPATVLFAVLGLLGILVNAALMLWTIQRVLQGEPGGALKDEADIEDLGGLELAAAAPLVFLAIFWGLWPPALSPYLDAALQPLIGAIDGLARMAGF